MDSNNLEKYQSELNDYNKAFELDPTNFYDYSNRGDCYRNLENYQLAIDDYTKAIELNPTNDYDFSNRGDCYFLLGNFQISINDYNKAIELDPTKSYYFSNRGDCYFYLENYQSAINDYNKAIELDPNDIGVLEFRANSFYFLGKLEMAILDFEKICLLYLKDDDFIKHIEKINKINAIDNIPDTEFNTVNNINITQLPEIFKSMGFKINPHNEIGNDFKNISGVYILEFKNNEYYIGETKKIRNRLKEHFKKHKDIENIFFKSIFESELIIEETKTIAFLEKNLIRTRNFKQLKFANIFNQAHQLKWVNDLSYNYLSGIKFDNQKVRKEFSDRFIKLKDKHYYSRFISLTSFYIKSSIPNYLASEYNYWNITCLPIFLAKQNFVSRININAVPVFSVYENFEKTLSITLFVSLLPFIEYLKENLHFNELFFNIPSLNFGIIDSGFENTDKDVIILYFKEIDFYNAMNNKVILSAIRLFNVRIMNKTGDESKYTRKRNHCLDLSDCIINYINLEK